MVASDPPYAPSHMAWLSKDSKRESRSSKASWVLDGNLAQCYFFHNSPERSSHKSSSDSRSCKSQVGKLEPFLHQSLLHLPWAQVGYPAFWQPRVKGKWDKFYSERQIQQAGWEHWVSPWASWQPGQKGLPNETNTESTSRERDLSSWH